MNWTVIIIVGLAVIALIIFIIAKNLKDKKELEEKIMNDYRKPKTGDRDIDLDDPKV